MGKKQEKKGYIEIINDEQVEKGDKFEFYIVYLSQKN